MSPLAQVVMQKESMRDPRNGKRPSRRRLAKQWNRVEDPLTLFMCDSVKAFLKGGRASVTRLAREAR